MNRFKRQAAVAGAEARQPARNERYCEPCGRWRVPVLGHCQGCGEALTDDLGEVEVQR